MVEHAFGNLIYTFDAAAGEALGKRESHTPKIDAPVPVKPDEAFDLKVTVGPHPNTVEHSIWWIMVTLEEEGRAFNPVVLAKVILTPVTAQPGNCPEDEIVQRRNYPCRRILQPPWTLGREKRDHSPVISFFFKRYIWSWCITARIIRIF